MADYTRPNPLFTFACAGMSLKPVDQLEPNKYAYLQNVRVTDQGRLDSRPGAISLNSTALDQTGVHSIRRLNDSTGNAPAFARIIGAGTKLYTDASTTAIDTGYSGDPLSMVPWRPDQSVEAWMYVADRLKMSKVLTSGTVKTWGISQPTYSPAAWLVLPSTGQAGRQYTPLAGPNTYVASGTATTSAAVYQVPVRGVVNVAFYPYTGSWIFSLAINTAGGTLPTYQAPAMYGIFPGVQFQIRNGAGTVLGQCFVEQTFSALADTSVKGISFDSGGSSGLCTVVPTVMPAQAAGNSSTFANPDLAVRTDGVGVGSFVKIGTEVCVILEVINGPDGSACFRTQTTGTHAAGEAIVFIPTVIVSSPNLNLVTVGAGNFFVYVLNKAGQVTAGTGYLDQNFTSPVSIAGTFGYGYKEHDYISVSLYVDQPANLSEVTLIFDTDVNGQNDYGHNGYYYVLDANVLFDPYNQGEAQWVQVNFRISDMLRIGTDDAASIQTIYGVRLQVDCVGTVNVSWTDQPVFFGGGAVDVGTSANDYYYRFRWRNLDGSYSNWSPATRNGLHLVRSVALLSVPGPYLGDKADVARFGGVLTAWTYIGTTDASMNWELTDNFADEAVAVNPQAQLDDFQPFPDIDVPHSGTCLVVGNKVFWQTGQQFSTIWAAGSEIIINGVPYTLYTSPTSATQLEIVENGTFLNGANFLIAEPTLLAQPMPSVWGPDDQGTIFAVGSKFQPGVVFFTNGNSPDNASDKNQLELGSPSEPLIGGVLNGGRAIVCSSRRWWALYPQLNGASRYQPVELQVGKPLFCRTGICSDGQTIAFLSDDGIYLTTGAQAQSITDDDLRDLFPHGSNIVGNQVTLGDGTVLYPVGLYLSTLLQRLSISDRLLFFDHYTAPGALATLVYDMVIGGWIGYDIYAGTQARCHYAEEGAGLRSTLMGDNSGYYHQFDQNYDRLGGLTQYNIPGKVLTGAFNGGDFRADKKWGDYVLDSDTTGATVGIVVTPYFANYSIVGTATNVPPAGRSISAPIDLGQQESPNLGIKLAWAEESLVILYGWQPSYIPQPVNMGVTPTDWDDGGYIGAKWLQGCIIESDTGNVARTIQVQGDGGVVGATVTVQQSGQGVTAYSWPPFITHLMRLRATDAGDTWKNYKVQWVWEPEPELAQYWMTQGTDHDLQGFMHVKEVQIAHISTVDISFTVWADLRQINLTIPNSGGTHRKTYLILPPNKAKIYTYNLISNTGFRLFKKDCEVRVKQWGSTGPYLSFNPFGGQSRADGAAI